MPTVADVTIASWYWAGAHSFGHRSSLSSTRDILLPLAMRECSATTLGISLGTRTRCLCVRLPDRRFAGRRRVEWPRLTLLSITGRFA